MFPENMKKTFAESREGFYLEDSPDQICYGEGANKVCMEFSKIGSVMFFHHMTGDAILANLEYASKMRSELLVKETTS